MLEIQKKSSITTESAEDLYIWRVVVTSQLANGFWFVWLVEITTSQHSADSEVAGTSSSRTSNSGCDSESFRWFRFQKVLVLPVFAILEGGNDEAVSKLRNCLDIFEEFGILDISISFKKIY